MTFSVLALNRSTGTIGCAAATGNLAVGGWVLRAAAGVGAVATQGASVSSLWGDEALALLAANVPPDGIVQQLTAPDAGRDHRQLAVLDRNGRAAAWSGGANRDVKGHVVDNDCVFAGNWLASPRVLDAVQTSFTSNPFTADEEFGPRLLSALQAGVRAGSDARGTLSAALRIVSADRAPIDLRIDYDEDPLARLEALYLKATNPPYSLWTQDLPTLNHPYRR